MRKFSLILTVFLMAAPALADVDIACSIDPLSDEVTVSYRVTEIEPNKVRAFALDIEVTGADIVDVNDNVNDYYYIYPGSIEIIDGDVNDYGTAVADPNDPGSITNDANAITIEMGALYSPTDDSSPNAPPDQNDNNWYELLKFTVEGPSKIEISENETRGGVVMTDPTRDPVVNTTSCDYSCWNYDCFECADGTGDCFITFSDLSLIIASWDPEDPYNPCADYNKDGFITFSDISVIIAHWDDGCETDPNEGCVPCTPIP